jgi:hypothetical protein
VLRKVEALFRGIPEEITILRAAAACALHKRDVGAALKRLRAIPQASPAFRAARAAVAQISLDERGDARAFIAAHLDVVRVCNDYDAHMACGDAFLRIQVRHPDLLLPRCSQC